MPYNAQQVATTMNIFGVGAPDAKRIIDSQNGVNQTRVLDPVQRSADKNFQKSLYSSLGDLAPLAYQLYNISKSNSAWSAQQASDLRNWQEGMMKYQMDFNASQAAKNRDWQEMMSNTAHQREVKDLIAAGLNPVLSATGGNGAAVTSGATASSSLPSGAMGTVDTSANSAIVGILGSMLSAQTSLASTAMSAANNLAIAEKQTTTSKEIADMNNQVTERIAEKQIEMGYSNAQLSYLANLYGADSSKFASLVGSQLGYDASIYGTNMSEYLTATYPNNPWQGIFSGANAVSQGAGFDNTNDMLQSMSGIFLNHGLKQVSNFLNNNTSLGKDAAKQVLNAISNNAVSTLTKVVDSAYSRGYTSPTESFGYKFVTGLSKLTGKLK